MNRIRGLAALAVATSLFSTPLAAQEPDSVMAIDPEVNVSVTRVEKRNPAPIGARRNLSVLQIQQSNPRALETNPAMGVLMYEHLVTESVEQTAGEHPLSIITDFDYNLKSITNATNISRVSVRPNALRKGSDLVIQQQPNVQPGIDITTDGVYTSGIAAGATGESWFGGGEVVAHTPEWLEEDINSLDPFMHGVTASAILGNDQFTVHGVLADLDLLNETFVKRRMWGRTNASYVTGRGSIPFDGGTVGLSATAQQGTVSQGGLNGYSAARNAQGELLESQESINEQTGARRMDITAFVDGLSGRMDITASWLERSHWTDDVFLTYMVPPDSVSVYVKRQEPRERIRAQNVVSIRRQQAHTVTNGFFEMSTSIDLVDGQAHPSIDLLAAYRGDHNSAQIQMGAYFDALADPQRDRHLTFESCEQICEKDVRFVQGTISRTFENESKVEFVVRASESDFHLMQGEARGVSGTLSYQGNIDGFDVYALGALRDMAQFRNGERLQLPLTPDAEIRLGIERTAETYAVGFTYAGTSDIYFPNGVDRLTNLRTRHIVVLSATKQFGGLTVGADVLNPIDWIKGIDFALAGYTDSPDNYVTIHDDLTSYTPYPALPFGQFRLQFLNH